MASQAPRRHVRHRKNPLLDSTTKDQEKAERPACSTVGNLRSQTRCGKSFNQRTKRRTEEAKKGMPTPRIELGFAEPQSAVLTTILCEPRTQQIFALLIVKKSKVGRNIVYRPTHASIRQFIQFSHDREQHEDVFRVARVWRVCMDIFWARNWLT